MRWTATPTRQRRKSVLLRLCKSMERLEKTQNRKNPVQGRILFAVPLGTSGINLELYRLIRFLREHPDFLNGFCWRTFGGQ